MSFVTPENVANTVENRLRTGRWVWEEKDSPTSYTKAQQSAVSAFHSILEDYRIAHPGLENASYSELDELYRKEKYPNDSVES